MAPEPVKAEVEPSKQTAAGFAFPVTIGSALTVTVVVALLVQPFASVPVTVNVTAPGATEVKTGLVAVASFRLAAGVQT